MSREKNRKRYYTDAEYRAKIIERAKISVKNRRMNALKAMHSPME